jgi:hypothetical protein
VTGGAFGRRLLLHASAYVSMRQHTSAYVSIRERIGVTDRAFGRRALSIRQHTSAYVSLRAGDESIRPHT